MDKLPFPYDVLGDQRKGVYLGHIGCEAAPMQVDNLDSRMSVKSVPDVDRAKIVHEILNIYQAKIREAHRAAHLPPELNAMAFLELERQLARIADGVIEEMRRIKMIVVGDD